MALSIKDLSEGYGFNTDLVKFWDLLGKYSDAAFEEGSAWATKESAVDSRVASKAGLNIVRHRNKKADIAKQLGEHIGGIIERLEAAKDEAWDKS